MKLNSKLGTSAVAAAVAIACGGAYAATITAPSPVNWSLQHNSKAKGGNTSTAAYDATVSTVLGADYIANDTVTLDLDTSVSGAKFVTNTSSLTGASAYSTNVTCANAGSATALVLSFLSRSDSAANYRVSGTPASPSGATCNFTLPVLRSTLATEGAAPKVTWSAKTAQSALAFDTSAVVATLGTVVNQFARSTVVTAVDGTVDVDKSRYQFETNDSSFSGTGDTLTFSLGTNATVETAAVVTEIVTSLVGDFSFIDNNGTAGCDFTDLSAGHGRIKSSGGTLTIDSGCSVLTFTATAGGTKTIELGTNSTAVTASGIQVLDAPQTFTMGTITYTWAAASAGSTGSTAGTWASTAAGEWDLNGSVSKISYMPYGTGISRIIYITNRSTQTGGVSATAINDKGVACEIANVATATKGSVTILSTGLDAGVAACYGADFNGKVAFEITANVPADKAEVYSAYNVNGNRVLVVNDTNGQ
jgi:hypothetical protein